MTDINEQIKALALKAEEANYDIDAYNEAIALGKPEWHNLNAVTKNILLHCFYKAGIFLQDASYFHQGIVVGEPEWHNLYAFGKSALLSCFYNAGVDSPDEATALSYFHQGIVLGEPEWHSLNAEAKGALLGCFHSAGGLSQDEVDTALSYCNKGITLGKPEWHSLNAYAKEALLGCFNNMGVCQQDDNIALGYCHQAFELGKPEWRSLNADAKAILLRCFLNAGVRSPDKAAELSYYNQAIALGNPEWRSLNADAKEALLGCFNNAGNINLQDAATQLNYYNAAIGLGKPEWDNLNANAKYTLLLCFNNAGARSPDEATELSYYNQAIALGKPEWQNLNAKAKAMLLGCFKNAGHTSPDKAAALSYYNQAIAMGKPEWDNLNVDAKEVLLGCFNDAGARSPDAATGLSYCNEGIALGKSEWHSLCVEGKGSALLGCFNNAGVYTTALSYYNAAIALGKTEWHNLNGEAKAMLLGCFKNAGHDAPNVATKLNYYKEAIALGLPDFPMLTLGGKNYLVFCGVGYYYTAKASHFFQQLVPLFYALSDIPSDSHSIKNLKIIQYNANILFPFRHYQQALSLADYLIDDLSVVDIDWLFTPQSALFCELAEALLVKQLSLPTYIIEAFQKQSQLTDIIPSYCRYVTQANRWQLTPVSEFGLVTLGLLAESAPDYLRQIYTIYEGLANHPTAEIITKEVLDSYRQAIRALDWEGIAEALQIQAHQETAFQAIYALYQSANLQFDGECEGKAAKSNWLAVWATGKMGDAVFKALQNIDIKSIDAIADFTQKLHKTDKESARFAALSAWVTNGVSRYLQKMVATYIDDNRQKLGLNEVWDNYTDPRHWSNTLFHLLPPPQTNLAYVRTLQRGHQYRIPHLINDAQSGKTTALTQLWRSLEMTRLGLQLNMVKQKPIKPSEADLTKIKTALQSQIERAVAQAEDPVLQATLQNLPEDTVTGIHEHPTVNPYAVLSALNTALQRADARLPIITPGQVQKRLNTTAFLVQLWRDNAISENAQLHALILSANVLKMLSFNHTIDTSAWQQLTPMTEKAVTDKITQQVAAVYTALSEHIPAKAKLILLPEDNLAQLPWHYVAQVHSEVPWQANAIELITSVTSWYDKASADKRQLAQGWNIMASHDVFHSGSTTNMAKSEYYATHQFAQQTLSDNKKNPYELLQHFYAPKRHHLIAHGIFNASQPTESKISVRLQYALSAWQIACSRIHGDVSLSVCQALSFGEQYTLPENHQQSTRKTIYSYLGPIGIGASLSAAGANSVMGSVWEVNSMASYLFTHYWHRYRSNDDTATALIKSQDALRSVTLKDIESLLAQQEITEADKSYQKAFNRVLTNHQKEYQGQPEDLLPFEHPYYWLGYTLLGHQEPINQGTHQTHLFAQFIKWVKTTFSLSWNR